MKIFELSTDINIFGITTENVLIVSFEYILNLDPKKNPKNFV